MDDNKIIKIDSKVNKTVVNLSKNNQFKNLIRMPNIEATKKPNFPISNTKKVFNYLRKMFIKALIL